MGMENPSPGAGERYSTEEAFDYVGRALPDAALEMDVGRYGDISVMYDGKNRREVFVHLLKHGWAITSVDTSGNLTTVWLEPIDG